MGTRQGKHLHLHVTGHPHGAATVSISRLNGVKVSRKHRQHEAFRDLESARALVASAFVVWRRFNLVVTCNGRHQTENAHVQPV